MAPSSFTHLLLFSLLILLSTPLPSTLGRSLHSKRLVSSRSAAEQRAERLIRSLNLFPQDTVNIPAVDPLSSAPDIVEKRLKLTLNGDSNSSVEDLGHHAGYFQLPHTNAARMFYFFFESRNSTQDPVVIWLTGGPGCSSELALFYENGPFHITNNLSLVWNDYGWDKVSNILFVDQPTGTGFSYTTDKSDLRQNETGVSNDLYDFLQAFFKLHPDYAKNDFYITGESYAGHYIPALASRIQLGNKAQEGIHINMKGFAIGNGLTNPEIQYAAQVDYAFDMKLISKTDHDQIVNDMVPNCIKSIESCGREGGDACRASFQICNGLFDAVLSAAGSVNFYDIRKPCEGRLCYDFSNMEKFLNLKTVKDALGVGNIEFVSCSTIVYTNMVNDWMQNLEAGIPALLETGINVLIYAGEYDLICNWLGNSRWVEAMEWSGQKEFAGAASVPFNVDGKEAGVFKNHGPLSFLKVHDAGHMVPMDQPKASLEMLNSWMKGKIATSS